ncbi:hypothetical protein O4H52_14755 [Sphingomonadaceae bacterium G21617-S1]|nr:hypothetical protein [Sphingomonadaceae bacterium G21617-S1]
MDIAKQLLRKGDRVIEWQAALSMPKAASNRCSLLEAVQIVGRAKYGDEWTRKELHCTHWHEQPNEMERRRLAATVSRAPPPIPMTLASGRYRSTPAEQEPSPEERERAARAQAQLIAAQQAEWELNDQCLRRLRFCVDWLAQQCRDDDLKSYYRFESGGDLVPMSAGDWNIDNPLGQFAAKGGYERWFSAQQPARKFFVYIFFDRAAVEQAVTIFANAQPLVSDIDLGKVSPYLRFAVQMALSAGWTSSEGASTKDYREAEIKAAWDTAFPGIPFTNGQGQMLAAVTGFPNVQGIKNGLIAASRRKNGSDPNKGGK